MHSDIIISLFSWDRVFTTLSLTVCELKEVIFLIKVNNFYALRQFSRKMYVIKSFDS